MVFDLLEKIEIPSSVTPQSCLFCKLSNEWDVNVHVFFLLSHTVKAFDKGLSSRVFFKV